MMKIGFIGTGNMGGALASAAARSGEVEVLLANRTKAKAETLAERIGAVVSSNEIIAREADHIFLGVKPQMIVDVLKGIAPALKERKSAPVLISMVTGPDIARIQELAGGDYPVIRIMPNTPSAVGQGLMLVSANDRVTAEELAAFKALMAESGLLDDLPEHLIDAASAVSGCGPAYAYMFVEALADGAVKCGVPRAKAMRYAAQMLLGSASLLLETGEHPGALKDAVCSPGGSTIAGVAALEDRGFRGAAIAAVEAAYRRTKELG